MVDRSRGVVSRRAVRSRRPPVLILAILAVGLTLAVVSTASGRQQRTGTQPQWILFTADPTGLGVEQIFRVTPSGKGLEQLTKGPDSSEAPAFSPNGKRIAFTRLGAGIFSMNLDGTGLRRLTSNGRDNSPTWSPDGKQIAFLRPAVDGWKLYVMSARGAGERRLRLAPSAGRPSWTAQGLVIPTQGDLAKVDPRTGRVQKLFGARIDATEGMDTTSVSPDLSTLTYVGSRPPDPGDKGCGEGVPCAVFGLYVENLSKHQRPRILARNTGPAAFSPDGKSLAFVAQNHRILLRVLATGKSKFIPTGKRITPTTTSAPAWQPH